MQKLRFAQVYLFVFLALTSVVGACRNSDAVPPPPDTETAATGGRGGRGGAGGKGGSGTGGAMPSPTGGTVGAGGVTAPPDAAKPDAVVDVGDVGLTDVVVTPSDAQVPADANGDVVADVAPIVDLRPDMQPKDMGSDLARNLANGMACLAGTQCTSGNCVDGFCCNNSCTNPCQSCSMALTGTTNGKCATDTQMIGMKCGRGCQQFPGQALLAVVDKICTDAGQCGFPQIPANPEYCADTDPCTSNSCSEATPNAARCVNVSKCGATGCCCVTAAGRACTTKTSCTGPGKMCM